MAKYTIEQGKYNKYIIADILCAMSGKARDDETIMSVANALSGIKGSELYKVLERIAEANDDLFFI